MPATLNGTVFRDLNHEGQYVPGSPGISQVVLVLFSDSASGPFCASTVTDSDGRYSFTVTDPGTYTVYETGVQSGNCPPSNAGQPAGYTFSNTPRKQTVMVSAGQINNHENIDNLNFSHDSQSAPYPCGREMILFEGRPTMRHTVDLITGASLLQGPLSNNGSVNAIGFSTIDYHVYGYDQSNNTIVRVDNNGEVVLLNPRPAGMPAAPYSAGTMDMAGFYYLYVPGTSRFYTVDLRTDSLTFLKLVDPANGFTEQTSNYGTPLSAPLTIGDWAFSPADQRLYGVERDGAVYRIDEYTGTVTPLETTGPNPGDTFGSVVIDGSGNLYAVSNGDGTIYRYRISGDTAAGARFSMTPVDAFNDGALCPYAVIELDYGDAPDAGGGGTGSYNTLLTSNGPRHGTGSPLYLGTQVTSEEDAYQNATATGDDLYHGIQDDGLSIPLPMLAVAALNYSLSVTATNYTSETAYLYGWIDFNKNGLFEASEAAPVLIVPAYSGTGQYTLDFAIPAGTVIRPDHTFVRLRLTTELLTDTGLETQDTRSVGPAADGEVEDYILKIGTTTDVALTKTADRDVLVTGDLIHYTITITNHGPETALDVILEDLIPPEITNPMYSLDQGPLDYWPGTLALSDMPPGQVITVVIQGVFDGSTIGPVVNTASVTSHSEDSDPVNNSDTVITPVNRAASLVIEKTPDKDPAVIGESLTFNISVTNNGPDAAENVIMYDIVETDFENPEYSLDNGATWYPWHGQLFAGTLDAGFVYTFLLRGTVLSGISDALTNTASVTSDTDDPDPDDNTVTVIVPKSSSADLSVVKTGVPSPVAAGQTLTYIITVTNSGPSPAQDVEITDVLSADLLNAEYSTDQISWLAWNGGHMVGILEAGAVYTLYLRASVSPDAVPGTLSNTVNVASQTPDPDPGNNEYTEVITLEGTADLSVTKTAYPDTAISGEKLAYTILVTNKGPSDAVNIVISDMLPPGLENAQYSVDGINFLPWNGQYNQISLSADGTITLTILADVSLSQTEDLFNMASAFSDTFDPNTDNNTDTIITPADAFADLQIVKTGPDSAAAGEAVIYTLTITNNGPSRAVNINITDLLPAAVMDPDFTLNGIYTGVWNGSYFLASLDPSESAELVITGTLSPFASGTLVNGASVSASTPDPDLTNNTSETTAAITAFADISVIKAASPSPAIAGEYLIYTIVASNAGPSAAESVVLEDTIPSGLSGLEYSTDEQNWRPWVSSLTIGTIDPGVPVIIYIRGTIAASASGLVTNTVAISSQTPDPNPDNNTSAATTPVETSADLSIVKTAAPSTAVPGSLLSYTVSVSNAGPSDARNVQLIDPISSLLSSVEYSVDNGENWAPWQGTFNLGTLEAGTGAIILIRGSLSSAATGTIENIAIISSTTPDPDPDNNSSTLFTPIQSSADLSVVKSADPIPAVPGQYLTYTVTVRNAGPETARDVSLFDTLPAELSQPLFSTDGGTAWNPWSSPYIIGTLDSNADAVILLRGILGASTAKLLTNEAFVSSSTPDPDPDNNTYSLLTPVGASADISVTKAASPVPAVPGSLITYSIQVANAGPDTADQIVLTDLLSAEIQNPEASLNGDSYSTWDGSLNIGSLEAAQSALVTIRGTIAVDAVTPIYNKASVSSDTPDPVPDNNTAELETPLAPSANLSVTKSGSPNPAVPGEHVTYTLAIRNAGPSQASGIIVIDAVSSLLGQAEYRTDDASGWEPWTGTWQLSSLEPGSSAVLTIRGTLSASATGVLTNTAVVTSSTSDPDPSDNRDTEELQITPSADLSITKSASPVPAVPGGLVVYTLTASNAGPSDAANVTLKDTLSAQLTGQEYSADNGRTWNEWNGSFTLDQLSVGMTYTLLLRGLLTIQNPGVREILNTVFIDSDTPDPDPDNNSVIIITPVRATADLAIRKTASPSPVSPGEPLTYDISVNNLGPDAAENVLITDAAILNELENPLYSTDGGLTWSKWSGSFSVGTLQPGSDFSALQIRGAVPEGRTAVLNTAAVSSTTSDPDSGNNTVSITIPVIPSADLSITKEAAPSPAIPGETLTYTITLENHGPGNARNITLIDTVPAQLMNAVFSVNQGQTWQTWQSPYQAENLAAGDSIVVLIRGTLNKTVSGAIINTAAVPSSTPDPDPTNNTATEKTSVEDTADLSITKLAHPNPAVPGQYLTYSILVSNAGPADALNVLLTDPAVNAEHSLDSGIHWLPWTGSYTLGTVYTGTVIRLLLRTLPDADNTGVLSNTAGVTSSTPDPDPDNNTVTVDTPIAETADLKLEKTSDITYAVLGDTVTYQIHVSNLGNIDAENVMLRDDPPEGLENLEYSTDNGDTWNRWSSPYAIGTIPNHESRMILLKGTVTAATGSIVNMAYVTSDTPDPDHSNNSGYSSIDVGNVPSADLAVTKKAHCRTVCPGRFIEYCITVTNLGPDMAKDVIITDLLPTAIFEPRYSLNNGHTWQPWTGQLMIGSLADKDTVTLFLTGKIDCCAHGTITNTVTVSGSVQDPNPENNRADAAVTVCSN